MRRLRRALPWQRVVVPLGLLLAGVSLWWGVSTAVSEGGDDDRAARGATSTTLSDDAVAQRQALERYEGAVEEVAYEAGRVVVEGLRAGLGELSRGEIGDDTAFAERAASWRRQLENLRDDLTVLDPPPFLVGAHHLRLDAMDGYVRTARRLREAAAVSGADRERLLDAVIESGETADDVWEEADELVDRHRRRLGLPVTTLPGDVVEPDA